MSTFQIVITVISTLIGVSGVIVGWIGVSRASRSIAKEQAGTSAATASDLGYIKAGVDEIKAEQKEQRKTNVEFLSRLVAVEESVKQAHKRIDGMERDHHDG